MRLGTSIFSAESLLRRECKLCARGYEALLGMRRMRSANLDSNDTLNHGTLKRPLSAGNRLVWGCAQNDQYRGNKSAGSTTFRRPHVSAKVEGKPVHARLYLRV